jgi:hypothetical protein
MSTESQTTETDTLFGGRKVPVVYADGSSEEITVRQLPLAEYDRAFFLLEDEMSVVAYICGKAKQWLTGHAPQYDKAVRPESYQLLQAAAWEVNAGGFFSYADRAVKRQLAQLNALKPDKFETALAKGAALARSPSENMSPGPQPRPV